MPVTIKNEAEIDAMRHAGRLAAEVLDMIAPHVRAGVTTLELDRICHDYIVEVQHAIPAPLNYHGFPKSICTSVNHVVCHGIPGERKLRNGDVVNVDITVIKDGFHGDTSKMFIVGEASIKARRLVETAYECLRTGIDLVRPGVRLGDIGAAIQALAEGRGYSVVRVLRTRYRAAVPRRTTGSARHAGHRPRTPPGHDFHHRTHDQRR